MSEDEGVDIAVEFCTSCGYLPRTQWMVGEVLSDLQDDIKSLKIIPGGGGCFEWTVNGELVFSKNQSGRFPDIDELKEIIYSRV